MFNVGRQILRQLNECLAKLTFCHLFKIFPQIAMQKKIFIPCSDNFSHICCPGIFLFLPHTILLQTIQSTNTSKQSDLSQVLTQVEQFLFSTELSRWAFSHILQEEVFLGPRLKKGYTYRLQKQINTEHHHPLQSSLCLLTLLRLFQSGWKKMSSLMWDEILE